MEKIRILIVEDEGILALNIQKLLNRLGYDVCGIAGTGEDAIELAKQHRPDLMMMDIHLRGGMDGIQVAEHIRTFLDVPILYTTAFSDEETIQRAKKTEPSAFILKPFEIKDLQVAIEMCYYKYGAELKIRKREKWVSTVLKNIGDAVVTSDTQGRITYMNPVAEQLIGCSSQDAVGQAVEQILRFVGGGSEKNSTPSAVRGLEKFETEQLLQTQRGETIPVEVTVTDLIGESNRVIGQVFILRDISIQKKAEEEKQRIRTVLMQSQKMKAIGKFAGGIAHDFNNFLCMIQGYAELQLQENQRMGMSCQSLHSVLQAVEKANGLTQNLLLFSRNQPMRMKQMAVNETVQNLMVIVKCILSTRIQISLELNSEELFIDADPVQFEQVLMNLVLNAKDAMPSGGNLTIRTETAALDQESLKAFQGVNPGDFVSLSVSDTGKGMDEKTRQNALEPFFTKQPNGNGLGLWIVNNALKNHHGFIRIESAPGKGSTLTAHFPAAGAVVKGERFPERDVAVVSSKRKAVELLTN